MSNTTFHFYNALAQIGNKSIGNIADFTIDIVEIINTFRDYNLPSSQGQTITIRFKKFDGVVSIQRCSGDIINFNVLAMYDIGRRYLFEIKGRFIEIIVRRDYSEITMIGLYSPDHPALKINELNTDQYQRATLAINGNILVDIDHLPPDAIKNVLTPQEEWSNLQNSIGNKVVHKIKYPKKAKESIKPFKRNLIT